MTGEEKWEIQRVNIESLHASVPELGESSQRPGEVICKLLVDSGADSERIGMLSVNIESLRAASGEQQ